MGLAAAGRSKGIRLPAGSRTKLFRGSQLIPYGTTADGLKKSERQVSRRLGAGLKSVLDCGGNRQNRVDFRELEELFHIRTWADNDDPNAFGTAGNEVADKHSQARGVHLRHVREVEDMAGGDFCTVLWLELEDVAELNLLHRSVHVPGVEDPSDLVNDGLRNLSLDPLNGERLVLPHFCARGRHQGDCSGGASMTESRM
jgi:hypothetical protein